MFLPCLACFSFSVLRSSFRSCALPCQFEVIHFARSTLILFFFACLPACCCSCCCYCCCFFVPCCVLSLAPSFSLAVLTCRHVAKATDHHCFWLFNFGFFFRCCCCVVFVAVFLAAVRRLKRNYLLPTPRLHSALLLLLLLLGPFVCIGCVQPFIIGQFIGFVHATLAAHSVCVPVVFPLK